MTTKPKGVIAAGHQVTADAAAEMLHEGGNAFDAVLAGLFAACVPEIVLASLGGGGFLMAHSAANNKTLLYDFFVQTPAHKLPPSQTDNRSVIVNFGPASQEFHAGIGTSAVPGFVPGVFAIHHDLCSLPMARIIEPAVTAAKTGVSMNEFHAYLFSIVEPILTQEAKQALFCGPDKALLKTGQTFRNENLAATLEELAKEGPGLFIDGEIGTAILKQAKNQGGHLTHDDLANYRVERRTPLNHNYKNHILSLNPTPAASGALIAFGFSLLEELSPNGPASSVDLAHVMAATTDVRRTYAKDLAKITQPHIIKQQLEKIQQHTPAPRGTTHISVIDAHGNAAAATISNGEGNGVELGNYGFMLNNMLGEEDLNPNGFNTWQPGTRMSTMMAPTILHAPDGARTAMGSGGSNRIRTAILQVARNLIDNDMSLVEAIAAPRMHVEKCGTLSFEDHFSKQTRNALLSAFPGAHPWPDKNMFFGGVHTAQRQADGTMQAAADPRRSGAAVVI